MSGRLVGRGGLKLEAALQHFGIAAAVAGGRAIDVGASTGGFTEVLLAAGAAHVTAVDVGHGQLHERLRSDPRVESLERADWKTLSLHVAPGPFDFFTVDVSFVAGRSMLRGLAFRLRDGAEGVVLVKPQFELPAHSVRGGDVSDPALRARALATFSAKAGRLGFRVLGHVDSPVAGGEGTVEILAHLRFLGRTAALPARPGEERDDEARVAGGEAREARSEAREARSEAREARSEARVAGGEAREARSEAREAGGEAREVRGEARGARGEASAPPPSPPSAGERVGERGSAARPRPRAQHRWFAVAAPGLEPVVAAEVERLPGVTAVAAVKGGVDFSGDLAAGMAANLHLRVATRVLLRLGVVRAAEFSKLRRLLAKLPWSDFLRPGEPVRVNAAATRCRLYHTGAVAETAALGIGDRLGKTVALAAKRSEEDEAAEETASEAPRVLLRGAGDEWTVSVDSSGTLLHKRGWRTEAGAAPLRETLAAGMLALAGYDPALPLVDPMCGAGTIALEACALASGRAPGAGRSFAFERWPSFDVAAWQRLLDAAKAALHAPPAPLVAFDRDAGAVALARRNAERAGAAGALAFEERAFADAIPPGPAGLVLMNPPYGRRLGSAGAAARLPRELGRVLRARWRGWRAGVLAPDRHWQKALGLRSTAHPLVNGGLRVYLLVIDVAKA